MAEILVAVGQSIQAAINSADPGDTVKLASGVHILPGTLYVREGITLLGEDGAILDASGLSAGSYGIYVDEDGVTLSNFTLLGGGATGPARGIKAQADGAADRLENLTITDVRVENFHRAEVDINGADGAYLSNVTVDGQNTGGAGIALTDVTNVELNNISVANNNWGGVAIYSGGDFADTPNGSNGVTFTGTFTAPISAAQPQPILLQTANGYPITDYALPDSYDFAVYNATAADYLIFFGSAEEAIAYALASDAANSVIYQNAAVGGTAFVEGNIVVYPGMSIPAAHAAAKPGQVVHVIGNDAPGAEDDTYSARANAPDWFTGGEGDDTFFGGAGGGDRFVYNTANASDITDILKIGQNVFLTTTEGTDLINGVEEIQFANGDVYAVSGTNIVVNTEADSNATPAFEDGAAVGGNVLANDVDLDGASFTVHGIAAGASTTPTTGGLDAPVAGVYGSLTISADGQYSYTANNADALAAGETVTDTFTYTVKDGSVLVTETITITVTGTNDAPEIVTTGVQGAIFEDGTLDSGEQRDAGQRLWCGLCPVISHSARPDNSDHGPCHRRRGHGPRPAGQHR
ncbi:VCBS domain-containing protein [Devosia ginsengisoli]|uniref:VCBS domain-containing protein n=1 Tax=Devosia ginsengisoli TaxID=400770 RepID=UPI0026ED6323|nr:VCBS domain-containing protein [Devosia ginsengisoli]MCR6673590.1 VCBS domain-containing protein [Devosia ginsengisoli]